MTGRRYSADEPMRVGLAGFGNVGQEVARRLVAGAIPEARLVAVTARDLDKARRNCASLEPRPEVVALPELVAGSDVVVECATAEAFPEIARRALEAGRILLPVSVGALAAYPEILDLAAATPGTIRIVSGALPGLDAIRAAAEGTIRSVRLVSQIRPESLARESYVRDRGFDFATSPTEPVKVFEGTAREAAIAFPRHFNVAVSLSLAGIGLERTKIEVWANGGVAGTVHRVEVEADDVRLVMTSENLPSAANPRTSRIVAPSVMAALRALAASVQVGS